MNRKKFNLRNRLLVTESNSGLENEIIIQLQSILSQNAKSDAVVLYGSRAKGTFKKGSDIDLTLIGLQLTLDDLLEFQAKINETLIPYKVDLSLFHQIDNLALIEHIQSVGKILYRRN